MRGFTKRFAAVAMAAGLALGAAACEAESTDTTDPAQEAPADDTGVGGETEGDLGTDDGTGDLGGTETEGTSTDG